MARKRNADRESAPAGSQPLRLPRNAIERLNVGQSFAEYDPALLDSQVYVRTPAINAALDPASGKYFFVGRRGTGKTALRTYCLEQNRRTQVIVPELFSPTSMIFELDLLENTQKGPFRSLVSVFKRTLVDELLILWSDTHGSYAELPEILSEELSGTSQDDFDSRTLKFIMGVARAVSFKDDPAITAINKTTKSLLTSLKTLEFSRDNYTLIVDSIDDFWDGSDLALTYLTALMHACLEFSTQIPGARALLLLRENIFERVRARDPESSRVETSVTGLDWTSTQLFELIERRMNRSLYAKFPLGGSVWNAFFENPEIAKREIFEYCHNRPRDLLIYVSHAIDLAKERRHVTIRLEDVDDARRRFSDNRFKDLGDEYAENYPQIALVLNRFYGLGRKFTPGGIESFIRKLLSDGEITTLCGSWIFDYQQMEQFVRLLYNIGFVGLKRPGQDTRFRALGPQETSPPAVTDADDIEVHKSYWDALDLQDALVRDLPQDSEFGRIGVIYDLPGGLNPTAYAEKLDDLAARLEEIPLGTVGARDFETAVGDIIKLCFFRALENVEERVRNANGTVIRDWIASNRAQTGFWSVMRQRYDATQVIWECKNYTDLKADDFHQVAYYSTRAIGRLIIVAFRGKIQPSNFSHIQRIVSEFNGMVIPFGIQDLKAFVRQNRNGKVTEGLIQDRYDHIVRKVS